MSKAQRIAKLKEIIRELIKKNLAEVSTTATAGIDGTGTGHYDTPKAFASSASGSQGGHPKPDVVGYTKVNEEVIKEYVSTDNFNKDFMTAMDLVITQANNLKGPLAKHPIKRNVSKLKAVLNMYKKFIAPALVKADRDISKGFDLTRIKKDLADGKFKSTLEYQIMNRIGGRSYDSNEFYGIDDKVKKLLDRMHSELRKLVNIMDKAQLESVNEGRYHDWRNDESMTPKQKVGQSMREIRDALNELDKTVKMNLKLKTELNMKSEDYWKNTHKALTKISERLVKMANKIGNLK
jgi:hypothetical protein